MDARSFSDVLFRLVPLGQIVMKPIYNLLPLRFADVHGEDMTRSIQLPRFEAIEQVQQRRIPPEPFPKNPDQRFVFQLP